MHTPSTLDEPSLTDEKLEEEIWDVLDHECLCSDRIEQEGNQLIVSGSIDEASDGNKPD